MRSSWPPSSIQTVGLPSSDAAAACGETRIAKAETDARSCQRVAAVSLLVLMSSLIGSPLPILRHADADQLGIGEEDVGRQPRVIAVEERAGYRGRIENILVEQHHLPTRLACQDQGEIQVRVAMQLVVSEVVEDPPIGIGLPVEIG